MLVKGVRWGLSFTTGTLITKGLTIQDHRTRSSIEVCKMDLAIDGSEKNLIQQ